MLRRYCIVDSRRVAGIHGVAGWFPSTESGSITKPHTTLLKRPHQPRYTSYTIPCFTGTSMSSFTAYIGRVCILRYRYRSIIPVALYTLQPVGRFEFSSTVLKRNHRQKSHVGSWGMRSERKCVLEHGVFVIKPPEAIPKRTSLQLLFVGNIEIKCRGVTLTPLLGPDSFSVMIASAVPGAAPRWPLDTSRAGSGSGSGYEPGGPAAISQQGF